MSNTTSLTFSLNILGFLISAKGFPAICLYAGTGTLLASILYAFGAYCKAKLQFPKED